MVREVRGRVCTGRRAGACEWAGQTQTGRGRGGPSDMATWDAFGRQGRGGHVSLLSRGMLERTVRSTVRRRYSAHPRNPRLWVGDHFSDLVNGLSSGVWSCIALMGSAQSGLDCPSNLPFDNSVLRTLHGHVVISNSASSALLASHRATFDVQIAFPFLRHSQARPCRARPGQPPASQSVGVRGCIAEVSAHHRTSSYRRSLH